jgi:hypothetical protein
MLGEMWKSLLGYLEKQPYWSRLQPVLLVLFLYAGTATVVYQYVQWQYGLAPSPPAFIRSYLFKQVSLAFVILAAGLLILRIPGKAAADGGVATWRGWLARHRSALLWRALAVILILAVGLQLWLRLAPTAAVADVRVKFHPPERSLRKLGFDPYAFTYLIYELNRQQRAWHFEMDLDPFDQSLLSARDQARCDADPLRLLCAAQSYVRSLGDATRPFILITQEQLKSEDARYYYWLHGGSASVISAADWARYAEPSIYDYLAYSTVIQSILIHLDSQCADFRTQHSTARITRGDIFEFQPGPRLMQASVLSAHLSRPMEELLFNCFGPAYAADAGRLLSLEWLHDERVQRNLRSVLAARPPA